jgi:predicted dehydrogenase
LGAGKHVYCEWPLGWTTAEAVELTALAEARGLVTAVGLQARVNPAVMHLKELLEAAMKPCGSGRANSASGSPIRSVAAFPGYEGAACFRSVPD